MTWVSPPAYAQEGGSTVVSKRPPLEFLRIEDLNIAIELEFRYDSDEVDPAVGPTLRDTENYLREILELSGHAFLGHPNLVDLTFLTRFELSQRELDSDTSGIRDTINNTQTEFNLNARIFKLSDTPLNVFARRSQTKLDQQFGGSIDSLTTEYGARLTFRSDVMPHDIGYTHRDTQQSDRLGSSDFRIKQDSISMRGQYLGESFGNLTWDYTFDDVKESGPLRRLSNFRRHDAFIDHRLQLGQDNKKELRSAFRYRNDSGDFSLERYRLEEILTQEHSPNLESRLAYLYDDQTQSGRQQVLNRGSARVTHSLFDSLTTVGEVGASNLKLSPDAFQSDQYHVNLDLNYSKRVPGGSLYATALGHYNWQDDSDRGTGLQILDEQHVFDASDTVVLSRRNIITSTIVVTNSTGVITYSQFIDFTVNLFGNRVEIRRVLGGNIVASQTVLVDYEIGPEPGGKTTTRSHGITLRYRLQEGPLRGLSVFMRYLDVDETRPREMQDLFPEADVQDLVYGLEYDNGPWSLLAERQDHDSTLSPFERLRLELIYRYRFSNGSQFSLNAYYNDTDNFASNFRTTSTSITARWDGAITDKLHASLYTIWRTEDSSAQNDSEGFEQQLDLNWHYRQTSLYVTIRNSTLESDLTDTNSLLLLLGFRREF